MQHIKIRQGVFETNSSSMHSIAIRQMAAPDKFTKEEALAELAEYDCITDGTLYYDKLPLDCIEFGWGVDVFTDFVHKMGYAIASLYNDDDDFNNPNSYLMEFITWLKEFLGINFIQFEMSPLDECYGPNERYRVGSIDHQSVGTLRNSHVHGINVVDFVLRKDVVLVIDNDNH